MAQVLGRAEVTPAALASRLRLTLARLSRRVRQEGALAEEDLTPSRLAALATLEERGLAGRELSNTDRRVVRVHITEPGRALLVRTRTRRDLFLARRVGKLTADERAALARALPVMEKLLED